MPDGFIPGLNWTTTTAALTTPSFNLYKTARNCRYKNKTILRDKINLSILKCDKKFDSEGEGATA